MTKRIPPPPPAARTKRARNNETPASIAAKRVMRVEKRASVPHALWFDPSYGGYAEARSEAEWIEHRMARRDKARRVMGAPAPVESNMQAVAGALGVKGERAAAFKAARDNARNEWLGRTSSNPDLGPTPYMGESETALQFDTYHAGE